MFHRITVLFLVGFFAFTTSGKPRRCPPEWTRYKRFCYRYFSTEKTWEEAHSFCESVHAAGYVKGDAFKKIPSDLVSIHSDEEEKFVFDFWKSERFEESKGEMWIGLNDLKRDRKFVWVDNTPFDYDNWAKNEPNNYKGTGEHYGTLTMDETWNDNSKQKLTFICKMKRRR